MGAEFFFTMKSITTELFLGEGEQRNTCAISSPVYPAAPQPSALHYSSARMITFALTFATSVRIILTPRPPPPRAAARVPRAESGGAEARHSPCSRRPGIHWRAIRRHPRTPPPASAASPGGVWLCFIRPSSSLFTPGRVLLVPTLMVWGIGIHAHLPQSLCRAHGCPRAYTQGDRDMNVSETVHRRRLNCARRACACAHTSLQARSLPPQTHARTHTHQQHHLPVHTVRRLVQIHDL